MLRINISSLSRPELQGLLEAARARGQEELVERIEMELAVRAGRRALESATPSTGPESVDLDPEPEEPGPITFDREPSEPELELEALGLAPPKAAKPGPRRFPVAIAAMLVVGAGAALAWGLGGAPGPGAWRAAPTPAATSAPPAKVMTARVEALPKAPPAPHRPERREVQVATAEPSRPTPRLSTPSESKPVQAARPTHRTLDPCATPASPADGLVCNDLGLDLLDHEMREAYGRAMDGGADPTALRESQAAWRKTRDPISDPRALAQAYDRRIRELKAAAQPAPQP
jgi:uncharacterized protein YecT (DUF1311 family)